MSSSTWDYLRTIGTITVVAASLYLWKRWRNPPRLYTENESAHESTSDESAISNPDTQASKLDDSDTSSSQAAGSVAPTTRAASSSSLLNESSSHPTTSSSSTDLTSTVTQVQSEDPEVTIRQAQAFADDLERQRNDLSNRLSHRTRQRRVTAVINALPKHLTLEAKTAPFGATSRTSTTASTGAQEAKDNSPLWSDTFIIQGLSKGAQNDSDSSVSPPPAGHLSVHAEDQKGVITYTSDGQIRTSIVSGTPSTINHATMNPAVGGNDNANSAILAHLKGEMIREAELKRGQTPTTQDGPSNANEDDTSNSSGVIGRMESASMVRSVSDDADGFVVVESSQEGNCDGKKMTYVWEPTSMLVLSAPGLKQSNFGVRKETRHGQLTDPSTYVTVTLIPEDAQNENENGNSDTPTWPLGTVITVRFTMTMRKSNDISSTSSSTPSRPVFVFTPSDVSVSISIPVTN